MNDHVNDFYTSYELADEDLDLLAQIIILIRDSNDKTRPNIIETNCEECNFHLIHKYTSKICDMRYKDFIQIKNKAKNKLAKKLQNQNNLFDLLPTPDIV